MKTRVVVPLDGSPLAEQALPWAMTLGRGLPAELVLFHAVSIPSGTQGILDNAARNKLFQTAYGGFEKTMNALEKVGGEKGNPKIEAVMEHVSMLMYGCLKYQSL